MSQLSHAQFPLRRHPNLLVDHRRSRSAAVAEPRGANGEAVTGPGGRLQIGMVAGIKSERWPAPNRNPRPDCVGIRTMTLGLPPQAATTVIALMVGFAACSRPKRNSVLSTHIRCRMVASFRATATRARAIPRCLAIFMPHARKADHFLL